MNRYSPERWDSRFAGEAYHYGTEPNDFLREHFDIFKKPSSHQPVKLVCLAEGEGRNAVFLAEQGFEITAVDGSAQGLKKLEMLKDKRSKETRKELKIETVVSDLADYDFGKNKWDGVVSIWCHLPPALRVEIHKKSIQALTPSGVFLLEAYRPEQLKFKTGGPPDAELMMTEDTLRQDFGGCKIELLRSIERNIHEGSGHRGKSAVVQLIARK